MDDIPNEILKYEENGITYDSFRDQIIRQMAESIQKEIDDEIMCSLFITIGWHKIPIKFDPLMADWCVSNIRRPYHVFNHSVVFEDENDASWFALKWS